jgi:hypothetical protein
MEITPFWPQYVILILLSLAVLTAAICHGKPKSKYDVWEELANSLIIGIILYAGGFWRFS